MLNQKTKTTTAILLLLFIIVSVVPNNIFYASKDKSVRIIACSDFQNPEGNTAGIAEVNKILSAMQKNGKSKSGDFICCGDYDYENTESTQGI